MRRRLRLLKNRQNIHARTDLYAFSETYREAYTEPYAEAYSHSCPD